MESSNSRIIQGAWALPFVALALAVQLGIKEVAGGVAPLATFYLAVTLAALKGGRAAGFAAIGLGLVVALYFLMAPANSLALPQRADLIRVALFLVNGFIIAEVCSRYRASLQQAKRLRDEAVRSAGLLEAIGAASPDLIYAKDREFRTIYANAATLQTLGLESDQILGRATSDYASERTEGEQHAENDARVIESGEVQVSDEVFTSPDGTQRVFQSSKAPLRDATGKIVGIAGVSVDVTDQRHTAEQLRISEQRLRLALQAGRMAVWDHDAINDKLAASPELNKVLGYPEDYPLTIEEVRSRYLPGQRERLLSRLQDTLSRGENYAEGELLYQHPDGSVRSYAISGEIILDEQGQVSRTTGVLLDISRLRTTEASLMEREAELQAALEAGKLAIVDFDHRTGLFRDSPRLNELYGYAPGEQLTLEHVRARYHPDEAELVRSRAKIEGSDPSLDSFRWIIRLLLPDGADRWVEGVGEYIRDESGAILRSRGVLMDVTERVRADRHQQLLIAELNHRVKNTLAVVQSIAVHSFRGSETGTQVKAFEQRLGALASVHNLLTRHNWEGTTLGEVMEESVRPFRQTHADAFTFYGPRIEVSPKTAVNLALAVTELATNALKYGALSAASGQVCIQWSLSEDGSFELSWRESGGPRVTKPERRGFGTRMIERVLANELQGSVELNFAQEGLSCTVRAPTQPSLK